MFVGIDPVMQALYGTLFTWAVTALGALCVVLLPLLKLTKHRQQRVLLDVSLGFAAGVMLAASFWSLLDPAVELARESETYGDAYAWFPPAAGFLGGCVFIYASDRFFVRHAVDHDPRKQRLWLLILAITLHNAPEGLAVGVGFGSVGRAAGATFARARNLAIGIGLQNFPEGLAVSMPLYRAGTPLWQCVFYGQLSGMVEPICGVLGAYAVQHVEPLLPYALAFAAGAMIYVVVDAIIPEAAGAPQSQKCTTWGAVFGFLVMMIMDVAL